MVWCSCVDLHACSPFNQFRTDELMKDANTHLAVLNAVLNDYYERAHRHKYPDKPFPTKLYWQLDNTASGERRVWMRKRLTSLLPADNKNRFIFAFCALLVHLGVFEVVKLSFLPVGHTHEDIDQGFQVLAGKLRKADARTLPQLLDVLEGKEDGQANADKTRRVRLLDTQNVFDFKKALEPCMDKASVTGLDDAFCIKFAMGTSDDGECL